MPMGSRKFATNIFQKSLICDKINDIYYQIAFEL